MMSKEYRDTRVIEGEVTLTEKPAGTVGRQLAAAIKKQKGGFTSLPNVAPGRQKEAAQIEVEEEKEDLTLLAAAKRYRKMYQPTIPPPKKERDLVEKLVDKAKKAITKGII